MIKLERNFIPDFFTRVDLLSLTQEFKDNGTSVWHHPEVKSACLKLSNGKCAFCEVKLEEASTYNEIEHFKDKKISLMMLLDGKISFLHAVTVMVQNNAIMLYSIL
ncbi:TPA: hypothetical protein ACHKZ8_005011 [Escherichia coli]